IAIALAFVGMLPSPLPLTWLHKFYLGDYLWGVIYLVLAPTLLPKVACCLEGIWYLSQSDKSFVERFPQAGALLPKASDTAAAQSEQAQAAQQVAVALRDVDQLRQDGLISEQEFEQKRRQLLGEKKEEQKLEKVKVSQSDDSNSIDANTASVDEWLKLPGLSIHQAQALVALTQRGVQFNCIEDVAAALTLSAQQVEPWQAMLTFCYYEPDSTLEPTAINANTATAEELATVPNIDLFLGRAIVHYRKDGPYRSLADLQDRLRLTMAVTAELLHYLRF
ncbi:MAG: helix-hairpin-helix domain-containing protein, partial [Cyanobacteria bacterium J06649_4]